MKSFGSYKYYETTIGFFTLFNSAHFVFLIFYKISSMRVFNLLNRNNLSFFLDLNFGANILLCASDKFH